MRFLFKMVLAPVSLFVAFLALMAKWLLTLSSYVVAPLMLYIFGCGIYTVYELATNELAAAKEHLTTEEYEEILAFGANW